jgi:hypothetical protein
VGSLLGASDGTREGETDGSLLGTRVGSPVGRVVGLVLGAIVGTLVGRPVGRSVGRTLGAVVGSREGVRVGACVGPVLGAVVGTCGRIISYMSACQPLLAFLSTYVPHERHSGRPQIQRCKPTVVGAKDGRSVGALDGRSEGVVDGVSVGAMLGPVDGGRVLQEGEALGGSLPFMMKTLHDTRTHGTAVGPPVGVEEGCVLGDLDGATEGTCDPMGKLEHGRAASTRTHCGFLEPAYRVLSEQAPTIMADLRGHPSGRGGGPQGRRLGRRL